MQINLPNSIRSLLIGNDAKSYRSLYERKRTILASFFLYFFLLVSSFFVIVALLTNNYQYIYADSSFLILAIIMIYLMRVRGYIKEIIYTFVFLICAISTLFTLTGGLDRTGIMTIVLIPIPIILLLGKKKGLWVLLVFTAINIAGFLFLSNEAWLPSYNQAWLERVIVVYIIICLMAYSNEYVFDLLYSRLETVTNSMRTSQERYKRLAINKEKFLSLISHDLGHHVENFATTSRILNEQFDSLDDEQKKKLIGQLANISAQNSLLLQDLLKWSTVQNEIIPYVPKPIKLEGVLKEAIELYDTFIHKKRLSLFLKVKTNGEVYADSDMLASIIRNLLSNAIKFSKEKGEITISAIEKGDYVLISFRDNGIGMTPQEVK